VENQSEKKQNELKKLYEEYKKDPSQFTQSSYTEDANYLRQFGIFIPGKDSLSSAYLKLLPSDFIVEEILKDSTVCTIDKPETITWPQVPAFKHAVFATLVKCGLSTLEAMTELTNLLECEIQDIHYAGLKDKNAITAQRISIHNVPLEKINQINSSRFFLKDIKLDRGGVEKSGLIGNRFTILLRSESPINQDEFDSRINLIKKNGFYNFYYLQRFGMPRLNNYMWGFDILKGNYEKVVRDSLCMEAEREMPFFRKLRGDIAKVWPDVKAIKSIIFNYSSILISENKLIEYLETHPKDYAGALKHISDQTMLWTYGFVSLLFNELLTSYIKSGKVIPEKLPLMLSTEKQDVDLYRPLLESIKYYPLRLANLKPFPHIRPAQRFLQTVDRVDINAYHVIPEGVVISFSLAKGEYATTMLAHLFNIISGTAPTSISHKAINSVSIIGRNSIHSTLEFFKESLTEEQDMFAQFRK